MRRAFGELTATAVAVAGLMVGAGSAQATDRSAGMWSSTGSMSTARFEHTATLLANGEVLVAGGLNASAELYNPAAGTWSSTGSMSTTRVFFTATLLPNGEVLVAGGLNASAELYNPVAGTWTSTGSMGTARFEHTATLLPNGQVLVAGGFNGFGELAQADLYNPATGTWSSTGGMNTARAEFTATLLLDGEVLVAGGFGSSGPVASAELYNPTTGAWTGTGSMSTLRAQQTATLLPDGEVLVVGGAASGGPLAELYNPATGIWSATGSMSANRFFHTAALLPDGEVLVAGGEIGSSFLASAELYNPATNTWSGTGGMSTARSRHTATLLPNGKVLVAGGLTRSAGIFASLASAELYSPGLGDAAIRATGTNFNASEGMSFSGIVASFADPDTTATASEYSAAITWGDGTTASGTMAGSNGSFTVGGTHSYAEEGSNTVTVTITDVDNTSNAATAQSTANVSDAALAAQCAMPAFTQSAYSGPTASVTDQSATGTPSDFSASIDWGDGSNSTGTITGGPGTTPYTVGGSHAYAGTGSFAVTTTVNDVGGSTTATSCNVVVFAFATSSGAPFVIGDLESTMGSSVTWWSSQWAKLNPMSGGPAPSSMKGFAGFEDNPGGLPPACGGRWTTDTGNATPPPPSVPDYMGVVVSSKSTQSGPVISGDIKEIVIVRNNPGYGSDPGHPGTGTVLGILCVR